MEDLFEERKRQLKETVLSEGNLPKPWEKRFSDGDDQRIWFDKIFKKREYFDFINEIEDILDKYGIKILTDLEKEEQFYKYICLARGIPMEGVAYFTDNSDMRTWYNSYKDNHQSFETKVHFSLPEYDNLDMGELWSYVKDEFIFIIKKLNRIPKHGEAKFQNGIDVRSVYDKLEFFDPLFYERVNLYLSNKKKDKLTTTDRVNELLSKVSELGYIPSIQEARFSDKCDMFTWYSIYKEKVSDLEKEVNKRVTVNKTSKVNIYLIPNFRNTGGKFYTIVTNVGEVLDLSGINTFEEAKKLDSTLVKRGGIILKKDEEISSISLGGISNESNKRKR